MDSIETIVVGAGVVGLAIARELAASGREVVLLEAENAFGTETSSRNSEVIHAGIYYEPGSLKARLCVDGRERLYPYLFSHGVEHRRCEKLIVAAGNARLADLERIDQRARAAGVSNLLHLSGREASKLEPSLECHAALLSPSTGIVDSHGLMLAFLGDAQDNGAVLALKSRVCRVLRTQGRFHVKVQSDDAGFDVACRELINSAGLGANAVASAIEGLDPENVPPLYLAKGNYFSLGARCPFARLIYPTPNEAGLGVHLTLDLAGQGRFGPDVEWVDRIDYDVDASRSDSFYEEIRTYWPALPSNVLHPSYSGIRPKLAPAGSKASDFRIDGPVVHGLPGLVNLFGIESPGLTASLAIATLVRELLDESR